MNINGRLLIVLVGGVYISIIGESVITYINKKSVITYRNI